MTIGTCYEIVTADGGPVALSLADKQKIHLVISDVNMPEMDGFTFVRELKGKSAFRFTPVVMLTTESGADMVAQGKASGAKAWLVKPFDAATLLDVVSRLIATT